MPGGRATPGRLRCLLLSRRFRLFFPARKLGWSRAALAADRRPSWRWASLASSLPFSGGERTPLPAPGALQVSCGWDGGGGSVCEGRGVPAAAEASAGGLRGGRPRGVADQLWKRLRAAAPALGVQFPQRRVPQP